MGSPRPVCVGTYKLEYPGACPADRIGGRAYLMNLVNNDLVIQSLDFSMGIYIDTRIGDGNKIFIY